MIPEDKKLKNIRSLLRENAFIHISLGLTSGIMIAEAAPVGTMLPLAYATAGIVLAAYSFWITGSLKRRDGFLSLLLLLFLCTAIGYTRFRTFLDDGSSKQTDEIATCHASVDGAVRDGEKTLQMDLRLRDGRKIRATLMKHEGERPMPGDVLLIHGEISAPRNNGNPEEMDYVGFLEKHGYNGTLFCYADCWKTTGRKELTLKSRILRLRNKLTDRYREHFSGRELAVIAALTLGDKTMLRTDTRKVFSDTGTSHILALSGLHLGLLVGLYLYLLHFVMRNFDGNRRRKEVVGFIIGMLLTWGFTLLAGMPLSLVRAAIMFSLVQIAALMQRDVLSLNNLAFAAAIILLITPEALFDIGFQLSFLSVTGILMLLPLFPKFRYHGGNFIMKRVAWCGIFVWNTFCVSLAAITFTLPVVAHTFHTVAPWGWAASIVAIPLTFALLFCSLLFFIIPFVGHLFATPIEWLLKLLLGSMEAFAALPLASVELYPTAASVLLFYIFILIAYSYVLNRHRGKLLALVGIIAAIVVIEGIDANRHRLHPQVVFYNTPSATALHIIESSDTSYLWTTTPQRADTALARVRQSFWKRYGIAEPILLTGYTETATFSYTPHTIALHGCRIGLAYDRMKGYEGKPLHVDYLYFAKGWRWAIAEALNSFAPDSIILDASLSDFYRRKFSAEADSLGLPCRDIRREGALVVTLKGD